MCYIEIGLFFNLSIYLVGFPGGTVGKESACQCRRCERRGFDPWSRKWQPTPVLLPGKFYGQRSLAGCSPWGCKESDMTEHTCTSSHLFLNNQLSPGSDELWAWNDFRFIYIYSFQQTFIYWAHTMYCMHVCSVTQPCPTLCCPMDSRPPASSVHEISQAGTLESVAIS